MKTCPCNVEPLTSHFYNKLSRVVRKPAFCIYAKKKTQISFAETAKLISAFVFATRIVQSLYFLNLKFQAYSCLLWLHCPVCVGPGRKPRRPVFSQRGSYSKGNPIYKLSTWLFFEPHEIIDSVNNHSRETQIIALQCGH